MTEKKTEKSKKTNWKTTDKRFVAFLDLLGFKDKVARKNHNEIYNELTKISSIKKEIESVAESEDDGYFADADTYVVSFSDSIVLFSKNDNIANFEFFLIAIRYLFADAIAHNIAIKGGIAHGEISLNKSEQIYFGQPIIDAYLIEEDVNYLGVVCHNSIDYYLNKSEINYSEQLKGLLFEFMTPLKCGKINHINLDWFINTFDIENKSEKEIELEIISILKNYYVTVSGSPRRYIDNTIDLFKDLIKNKKVNLKSLDLLS
tara:strand:- start:2299 stop:3081 length:783 start_codon:yes stop_codon:yes gene_type:complete